jgi:hypothetical protein
VTDEPATCSEGGEDGCPPPAKAGFELCGKHLLAARKQQDTGLKRAKLSKANLEHRWRIDERLNARVRAVVAERLAAV